MQVHKRQGASSVATAGSLVPEKSGKDRTDRSFEPGERNGTEKAGKREVRGARSFFAEERLSPDTPPVGTVRDFPDVFGVSPEKDTIFHDRIGTPVAIGKRLFVAFPSAVGRCFGRVRYERADGNCEREA